MGSFVKLGNFCIMSLYSLVTWKCLGVGSSDLIAVALVWSFVRGSINLLFFVSTNRLNLARKSAPNIGLFTEASTKEWTKFRLRPISRFNNLEPNVGIEVPLAAESRNKGFWGVDPLLLWGRTDRSAPVSTRKVKLEVLSLMNKRRVERHCLFAAATAGLVSLGYSFYQSCRACRIF